MGVLLLLDQVNVIDRNLLVKGHWEREQIEFFRSQFLTKLPRNKIATFLDIGAHEGLYSMILAQDGFFQRIVAFEPDPRNLIQLRINLLMNNMLQQIEIAELAASDSAGRIPFFVATDEKRGGSRIIREGQDNLKGEIEVEAVRLDDKFDITDSVLVAKIDVEGAELKVLRGMEKLISSNICLFQIESFDDVCEELREFLESRGFKLINCIDFDYYYLKATAR